LNKNTRLVVLVLALLGAAGVMTYRNWPPRGLSTDIAYVCVATGEVFEIPRNDVGYLPFENPKSGQETLVPVQRKDGHWVISEHYRKLISSLGEVNKYVDPNSLEIRSSN
jgi:hypothetical protein